MFKGTKTNTVARIKKRYENFSRPRECESGIFGW